MNEYMENDFDYNEYYDEDVIYRITPKGIASLALSDAGICDAYDERINAFWTIFVLMMEKHGYLESE